MLERENFRQAHRRSIRTIFVHSGIGCKDSESRAQRRGGERSFSPRSLSRRIPQQTGKESSLQTLKQKMTNRMEHQKIFLRVGEQTFPVELEGNTSAEALKNLLEKGDRTVRMEDYARMEKVGDLGVSLSTNDRPIDVQPGDVILYQGHYLTVYYGHNHYPLTRLGRIKDLSPGELERALGRGSITVVLSLKP